MGTYVMSNDYQVSGRRMYHQKNGKYLIYLHDWGPHKGMEWTFSQQLGMDRLFEIIYLCVFL